MADTKIFTSEEERSAAYEEVENKLWTNSDDMRAAIDEIDNAEIVSGDAQSEDKEPVKDEYLPEDNSPNQQSQVQDDTNLENNQEDVQDDGQQKPVEDDGNNGFQFNQEYLDKYDVEYIDSDGRRRNIFTHKTEEDFYKSYANAQKKIRYDNEIRIPQLQKEHETKGYSMAEQEYKQKLEEQRKELEKYKQLYETNQTKNQTNFSEDESLNEIEQSIQKLQGINDEDLFDHGGDIKGAISTLARALKASKNETPAQQIDVQAKIKEEVAKIEQHYAEKAERENAAVEQKRQMEAVYNSIDQFTHDPQTPDRFKVDQKWEELLPEVRAYNDQLLNLYARKYPQKVTGEMTQEKWHALANEAIAANLRGDPALVNEVNKYLQKPKNYDKWIEIDNLDAIKNGWHRNDVTKEWEQRYDVVTQKPVNFGDLRTAMNFYLDQSGERDEMVRDKIAKSTQQFAKAVNKRANNITELSDQDFDTSSGELTDQMALDILDNANVQYIANEKRMGNNAPYEQLVSAYNKLGIDPPVLR